MEILSFVLGIAFVVVIAIAIITVYAFVKVRQVKEELQTTQLTLKMFIEQYMMKKQIYTHHSIHV
jgi:heme/copper-type cytochrome/quinol oxidase subunit 2